MRTTTLISFTMGGQKKSRAEISKFYRELYGYENYSYYGRYRSRIKGFLDGIRNVRYSKGTFMVSEQDAEQVVAFLRRRGAQVTVWQVLPGPKERKALGG